MVHKKVNCKYNKSAFCGNENISKNIIGIRFCCENFDEICVVKEPYSRGAPPPPSLPKKRHVQEICT